MVSNTEAKHILNFVIGSEILIQSRISEFIVFVYKTMVKLIFFMALSVHGKFSQKL